MSLGLIIVLVVIWYYYKIPRKDQIDTQAIPRAYCIESNNEMPMQDHYECAAFSSAFVLRHFGVDADGQKLYEKYPRKLLDGTISPKGIIVFFQRLGYDASYLRGDIDTLKKQISLGTPVIMFIRVNPKQRYLHFVPVVGYDETHFYLVDSLSHTINCNEAHYNRKISFRELEGLWRTWLPFCQNSYIVVKHKEKRRVGEADD
ncbi:cysteine peptidase family C39 domain-containing protein [Paenibacillus xylanexedens]|uniref:cysteine peptidase family C39 domain-containing protein n=1 Tax=Paenibacillus xylanexedens TaxID=528191 RepID=UPI0011A62833|nr:cysteine peptidase family C39 domain-containing protein [Paenibacillus xylanexedens]